MITHLVQLKHAIACGAGFANPTEASLGQPVVIIERDTGSGVIPCTFGSTQTGSPLIGAVNVDELDHAQRGIWETQRCLVPVVGFHQMRLASGISHRWLVPQGQLAYLPALRHTVGVGRDRHCACQVLVRRTPSSGALPFRLMNASPTQWLASPGPRALKDLSQDWLLV